MNNSLKQFNNQNAVLLIISASSAGLAIGTTFFSCWLAWTLTLWAGGAEDKCTILGIAAHLVTKSVYDALSAVAVRFIPTITVKAAASIGATPTTYDVINQTYGYCN